LHQVATNASQDWFADQNEKAEPMERKVHSLLFEIF
jgi:hypothetical protein